MTLLRYAPSPTGYQHVGNIRTALINWLFAKKMGGEFMLRFDDTDSSRSKEEYETAIEEDLAWLGITYDKSFRQRDRFDRYEAARDQLIAAGRLYACYETAEELEVQRKMLGGRGLPPIYDRTALKLTDAQKAAFEAEGRTPHWRFELNEEDIIWEDLIRGEAKFSPGHMSDPVLIRADGIPLYTLASVVDDGEMNVTHIVRGEDHVSNTAVQMQLFDALGFTRPQFAHMALLKTQEGELSKRVGSNGVRILREEGIEAMALNSLLAKIGTSDPIEVAGDMQALIDAFDFSKFSRAPANFDVEEVRILHAKILHDLPFEAVQDKLGFAADQDFWDSVKHNISDVSEAKAWWDVIQNAPTHQPSNDDAGFLKIAAELLPQEPWDETTFSAWTNALKAQTDRKGKTLFMPLRLALTGMQSGPELKVLLPLLGREKALNRLL